MSLRPHPLSNGFCWTDRPLEGLRALSRAEVSQYNREGYCVLEGAIGADEVAAVMGEIDAIEQRIESTTFTFDDAEPIAFRADDMTFAVDLVGRAPGVEALCRSALFAGIVHDLVGDDARLYWNQAVYKKPQKGRVFPWHQDNGYSFTEPQTYLTCWIPLTPATLDNGCPWIVPAIHRLGTLAHESAEAGLQIAGADFEGAARAVEVAPGDIVLFSSLTPHRTGANLTQAVRKVLILQFAPDGLVRVLPDGSKTAQRDPLRNILILKDGKAPPD